VEVFKKINERHKDPWFANKPWEIKKKVLRKTNKDLFLILDNNRGPNLHVIFFITYELIKLGSFSLASFFSQVFYNALAYYWAHS
jgi:hypothetical protein